MNCTICGKEGVHEAGMCCACYMKKRYNDNKSKILMQQKQYRQRNVEKYKKIRENYREQGLINQKKYIKAHPDRMRAYARKMWHRQKQRRHQMLKEILLRQLKEILQLRQWEIKRKERQNHR